MTPTITIDFDQPDERPDGREESAWYTFSSTGHDSVLSVANGDRELAIYADGEMDIRVYRLVDGEIEEDYGRIRYCEDFADFGIRNDADLQAISSGDGSNAGGLMLAGPWIHDGETLYFDFIHNSWFDIYTLDGDHLDVVCHELSEAIAEATKIVSDDGDDLWKVEDSDV